MLRFSKYALIAIALCVAACSSDVGLSKGLFKRTKHNEAMQPSDLARSDDKEVAELYNDGLDNMSKANYITAAKKFGDLEREHPYSKWATKALLLQAFTYYQDDKYSDAINSCQRFIALHPGHENSDYAYYLIALSQYEQISDVQRDQSMTQSALDSLEELARRYPNSKYAADARQKALLARDHLAGQQMEIGRYYYKQNDWNAGINRFKTVITTYQQTSQAPEALYRLAEGYMALGIKSEAQTAAAVLAQNFPKSNWYKSAYALVTSDGLSPVANQGSWISRAFN